MISSQQVIDSVKLYCSENFINAQEAAAGAAGAAATTDADLIHHFSDLQMRQIPLLSIQQSNRFHFVDGLPNTIEYFGRENFEGFVQKMCDGKNCRVVGATGGGKTHMLAAFVLYMNCKRLLGLAGAKHVVYVSACGQATAEQMPFYLSSAVKIAFPDDAMLQETDFLDPSVNSFVELRKCIHAHKDDPVVFVYDDWNYFLGNTSPLAAEVSNVMLALCCNKQRIEGISANAVHEYKSKLTEFLPEYTVTAGLSDLEWEGWRANFPLLNSINTEQLRREVKYMTGFIPLYLYQICQYGCNTFSDAMGRFDRDDSAPHICGRRLHSAMVQFVDNIILNTPHHIDKYISMMADAMIEKAQFNPLPPLVDNRFFAYDSVTGVLRAINGYVTVCVVDIITAMKERRYLALFNIGWVRDAMQNDNPIIKGFALEMHQIAEFILKNKPKHIVRFQGDYPMQSDLLRHKEGDMTFFWPRKWNLRHVDWITRTLTRPMLPVAGTNRAKRGAPDTLRTEIVAYQVTMQAPSAHIASLSFYTQVRGPAPQKPDCCRYESPFDAPHGHFHKFVWVLPSNLPANVRVAPATVTIAGRNPPANAVVQQVDIVQIE